MTISDVAAPAAPVSDVAARRRPGADRSPARVSSIRHYVMTPPTYFAVEYAINPWMDTSTSVDTHAVLNQWETLRQTYKELGHTVELIEPVAGLPDMVYAANGGLLVNGKAVVARFAYPQRAGESAAYAEWMTRHGYRAVETRHVNEGQGDLLVVGSIILAGCGFRTERQAHDEISASLSAGASGISSAATRRARGPAAAPPPRRHGSAHARGGGARRSSARGATRR